MKITFALAAAIMAASFIDTAAAQSFNCRYAKKPDEVLICQDSYLSDLDEEMAGLYAYVRQGLSGRYRRALKREQASWLRSRMRCGYDFACIEAHYLDRIDELRRY